MGLKPEAHLNLTNPTAYLTLPVTIAVAAPDESSVYLPDAVTLTICSPLPSETCSKNRSRGGILDREQDSCNYVSLVLAMVVD